MNRTCQISWGGCYFRSRTGEVDAANAVGKFDSSLNNILNVLGKQRNEMLAVHLVKTYCIPRLLFYCTVVKYGLSDVDDELLMLRRIIPSVKNGKIFNACWWESVKR